jgi:RNA polymerase-interacting CarD/CdnL/TRCF family regulator
MDDGPNSTSGYKRPPLHTQFKPGQSGNPSGRPKKKATTFVEALERELSRKISVVEGGERQKISKLDAIVKQQTNKAASGDLKATALLLGVLAKRQSEGLETLPPMLQALRAIHAKHEAADQNDRRILNDED